MKRKPNYEAWAQAETEAAELSMAAAIVVPQTRSARPLNPFAPMAPELRSRIFREYRVKGKGGQFAKGGGRVPGMDVAGAGAYSGGGGARTADSVHAELEALVAESAVRTAKAEALLDYMGSNAYYSGRGKYLEEFNGTVDPHFARARWRDMEPQFRADRENIPKLSNEEMTLRVAEAGGTHAASDPNAARWADVQLETSAVVGGVSGSLYGTAAGGPIPRGVTEEKWSAARDRYVVADTPTLKMNAALRGEAPVTAGIRQRASEARMLTSETLQHDAVLSRHVALTPSQAAAIRPGSVVENRGFQSTQTGSRSPYNRVSDAHGTVNVHVTLRAPAGTHAGDVGYGEIVLRPMRMRVVSAEWTGTVHEVLMEVEGEL